MFPPTALLCHCNISLSNNVIGGKQTNQVKCYNVINIFCAHFVLSQIRDDGVNKYSLHK